MAAPAPTSTSGRIIELDALRGLAVIGIVWMNVLVFALPSQAYYNPAAMGSPDQLERIVWAISFVFVEDKFRTLFAMMFGAGCIILIERAKARGEQRVWRAHYARMAVLLVIGVAHATLFASNDILRAYALAGLALPLLASLSVNRLIAVTVGLIVLHVGSGILTFGSGLMDYSAGRLNSGSIMFAERNFGSDTAAVQMLIDQAREGFGERVLRRASAIPAQLWTITASVPINLAGIALGIALWKDRMLAAEWRTFKLQRISAISALGALPGLLALAYWSADSDFAGAVVGPASLIFSAPFDTLLAVAYAALAMALLDSTGAITKRLAAAGRLSLTNYLLTSVILSAIFASWGAGLFGYVTRLEAMLLALLPVAAILTLSPLWLARFRQGPVERVWRSAAKLLS